MEEEGQEGQEVVVAVQALAAPALTQTSLIRLDEFSKEHCAYPVRYSRS